MMEAIIKRLEPEVLKYEKELDQLEKLMIELDVSSKAEQKELKRAPHRCAVHMQPTA